MLHARGATNLVLPETDKTCALDLDCLGSRSRSAVYHQVTLRSCPLHYIMEYGKTRQLETVLFCS